MAKQTFTTGQVLTAAQMTSLQQTAMLGGDASAKVASYVLVAADAGTAISMSNGSATTITVNTGLFAAGDIVTIINLGAGVCTITAGTATVTTSGSLALAQNQGGVLRFTSASAAIFFQFATPASGDIEGVTAGTGISGGGTSGTVTITNSMATEIDAKGDLIVGTGADTFARLAVGTNGHTLVADSTVSPTGLKWAAPASGSMTSLATGSLTGSSVTISAIDQTYINLQLVIKGAYPATADQSVRLRFNGDTNSVYTQVKLRSSNSTPAVGTDTAWYFDDNAVGSDDVALGQLAVIDIYNYADTTTRCVINGLIYYVSNTASTPTVLNLTGLYRVTDNIDSITIDVSSGNFGAGSYILYGVK